MTAPLIPVAPAEQRNATVLAISAAVMMRPNGTAAVRASTTAGSWYAASVASVRTEPGETALTRMPRGPHSMAIALVSASRAALLLP